jgi:hypothetical protein
MELEEVVTQINYQALSLSSISHRCVQESDHFFRGKDHDPGFCFELFRRAILFRNELAWERIYIQYERLVRHWVERHPAFLSSGEEVQFFMNRAFEKMWLGITPKKFEGFTDLKSILRYLQTCVHSVMVDFVRQKEYKLLVDSEEELLYRPRARGKGVDEEVGENIDRKAFWQWVQRQLQDDREKCVVYAMYELGMKSGEVVEKFPEVFSDVKEVYRVKENLLDRLRRNEGLNQFLDDA